jgi:hypothetical protein
LTAGERPTHPQLDLPASRLVESDGFESAPPRDSAVAAYQLSVDNDANYARPDTSLCGIIPTPSLTPRNCAIPLAAAGKLDLTTWSAVTAHDTIIGDHHGCRRTKPDSVLAFYLIFLINNMSSVPSRRAAEAVFPQ